MNGRMGVSIVQVIWQLDGWVILLSVPFEMPIWMERLIVRIEDVINQSLMMAVETKSIKNLCTHYCAFMLKNAAGGRETMPTGIQKTTTSSRRHQNPSDLEMYYSDS